MPRRPQGSQPRRYAPGCGRCGQDWPPRDPWCRWRAAIASCPTSRPAPRGCFPPDRRTSTRPPFPAEDLCPKTGRARLSRSWTSHRVDRLHEHHPAASLEGCTDGPRPPRPRAALDGPIDSAVERAAMVHRSHHSVRRVSGTGSCTWRESPPALRSGDPCNAARWRPRRASICLGVFAGRDTSPCRDASRWGIGRNL